MPRLLPALFFFLFMFPPFGGSKGGSWLLSTAEAQNLVPNPSFEDTLQCPDNLGQIDRCVGWFHANPTADYFHTCGPQMWGVKVPSNAFGYQQPATGVAYGGIYTFYEPTWREYLGIQLSSPLIIGQKYFVVFKTSMAFNDGIAECATNKIGALLSTVPYSGASPPPIANFAHVYTDSIITDSLNWITISGSFIADSAYEYINIGNFFDDSSTDTIMYDNNVCWAYYYIDDVCVSEDSLSCTYPVGDERIKPIEQIRVYPNPFNSICTVLIHNGIINKPSIATIRDVTGRIIKEQIITNDSFTIERDGLRSGIYMLNLYGLQKIITVKLIITD